MRCSQPRLRGFARRRGFWGSHRGHRVLARPSAYGLRGGRLAQQRLTWLTPASRMLPPSGLPLASQRAVLWRGKAPRYTSVSAPCRRDGGCGAEEETRGATALASLLEPEARDRITAPVEGAAVRSTDPFL